MNWWMWTGAGLALLALEVFTPGSLVWIFFAAGALATGALLIALPETQLLTQGIFFTFVSLLSLRLFRTPLLAKFQSRQPNDVEALVGEVAIAKHEIAPGAVGQAELRGTGWSATNIGLTSIESQARCRVEKVDGLMLLIRRGS